MARCSHIKANGERCKGTATGQHGLCWAHSPENRAHRSRIAAKGGRARRGVGRASLEQIMDRILRTVDAVEDGTLQSGSVVFQGLNVWLRAAELARRWRETEDLERRIEQLEEAAANSERSTWGR